MTQASVPWIAVFQAKVVFSPLSIVHLTVLASLEGIAIIINELINC